MSNSGPASSPSAIKELSCPHCGKVFGRLEHLKRHVLIHTKERSFPCRDCSKQFVRRDALKRHELTHQSAPNLLKRGARACTQCAAAKSRCSGESKCQRCCDRGDTCVYPAVRDLDGMQFSDSGHSSSSMVHQSSATLATPSRITDMQDGPTVPDVSQQNDIDLPNADLWDPSVLASTNWLDALNACDFGNFTMPNMPMSLANAPSANSASFASWNMPSTSLQSFAGPFLISRPVVDSESVTSAPTPAGSNSLAASSIPDQDSPESGQLYIHGGPARLPRTKRRKRSSLPAAQRSEALHTFSLAYSIPPIAVADLVAIDTESHGVLQNWYGRVCLNTQGIWPVFENADFPAVSILNHMVHLYFVNFDQVLPFMHRATLLRSHTDPLLALVMAAIGSYYLPEECISASFTLSLLEFARRITLCQDEGGGNELDSQVMSRVRLLLAVGLLYSGQEGLCKAGLAHARLLKEIYQSAEDECDRLGVAGNQDLDSRETRWTNWSRRETAIRLAHSAWLVDCMSSYHFGIRPSLRNSDSCLPLPCPEDIWNAQTAHQWADCSQFTESRSLPGALSELYIDKRLPRGRGEFARIIIIHGLFHRLWEVESYHINPMASWEPTAERQSSANMIPRDSIWLPGIQTFSQWQSASMDALDILHWQANATIGQASGLEHSTVMHLHLARIILLVPYAQILSFAKAWGSRKLCETSEREAIRRWAVQHQYKARLAVVHAGVVFWHVRRYSIDAFYEAPAVGLATLTLWAFSTFAVQSTKPRSPSSVSSDCSEADNIILLDRPTDDELVQQFIRHDQPFKAHLTAVGDLYGTKGPQRVLLQGLKLLGSLGCWGVNASWLAMLQGVSNAYPKE